MLRLRVNRFRNCDRYSTAYVIIFNNGYFKINRNYRRGIAGAIESIGGYLSDAKITEDISSNKEFSEFQENFAELLEDAAIEKLIVLIDDLDRCLPDVAINTLEAVRLFMFTEKTAFVIAADEGMIRYAVKNIFPMQQMKISLMQVRPLQISIWKS